jgi:hypothetical protein
MKTFQSPGVSDATCPVVAFGSTSEPSPTTKPTFEAPSIRPVTPRKLAEWSPDGSTWSPTL